MVRRFLFIKICNLFHKRVLLMVKAFHHERKEMEARG